MHRIPATISLIAWSLWFGALMALFVFVMRLFTADHAVATQAAPQLFLVFQKYALILAAIGLIVTLWWRWLVPAKSITAIFVLLGMTTCAGAAVSIWIVAPMEALRAQGLSGSPQFMKLHGESMGLFLLEAILLAICGLIFPFALGRPALRKDSVSAVAKDSPA